MAGTVSLGLFLISKFDQNVHTQATQLTSLVKREIDQQLEALSRDARLLSIQNQIVQATANQNQLQLQQTLLPLRGSLGIDTIGVIDRDQHQLFKVKEPSLEGGILKIQEINDLLLAGADTTTVVGTSSLGPPMLVGAAPIKNQHGVIGGVLLGTVLNDGLLKQINSSAQDQIIVVSEGRVVASTFPDDADLTKTLTIPEDHLPITIDNQEFFSHSIELAGFKDQQFDMVLLVSQNSLNQATKAIWGLVLTMGLVGAGLTTILGYWIAKRVARPIQDITLIAQQVAGENRFDLRAPAYTQDDISILALSVNQLIEWVGQYTNELEVSAQTLETRVKIRTKKLSNTLKELKATQAQLIQSEKMSSLGQMIAGIAHEINNPISFVQGNIDPLREYFQDLLDLINTYQAEYPETSEAILKKQEEIDLDFLLDDLDKLLGSMNLGAERVHEIVKSLRNFSRLDEATVKDVDIHEGIDSTLLILNNRIKHEVTVVKKYGDLPLVRCFPAQLNQVFTNIIVNSLDALSDADRDRKKLKIITRMTDKNHVQILICDNGPGIPREIRKKIFDPFFTTKPVGKGTGLGLGICFRIIQQHQGNIRVRSKLGKGTEFVITLPIDVLPADPIITASAKIVA
ncbi:MAG: ATP-binding protein [Cyanobacteria bacterium P01_F01_bin.13]